MLWLMSSGRVGGWERIQVRKSEKLSCIGDVGRLELVDDTFEDEDGEDVGDFGEGEAEVIEVGEAEVFFGLVFVFGGVFWREFSLCSFEDGVVGWEVEPLGEGVVVVGGDCEFAMDVLVREVEDFHCDAETTVVPFVSSDEAELSFGLFEVAGVESFDELLCVFEFHGVLAWLIEVLLFNEPTESSFEGMDHGFGVVLVVG